MGLGVGGWGEDLMLERDSRLESCICPITMDVALTGGLASSGTWGGGVGGRPNARVCE